MQAGVASLAVDFGVAAFADAHRAGFKPLRAGPAAETLDVEGKALGGHGLLSLEDHSAAAGTSSLVYTPMEMGVEYLDEGCAGREDGNLTLWKSYQPWTWP
jgi:hypothetical protein